MDCHKAQAQFDFSTLGVDAATGPDALEIQRHLAECDCCRLAFDAQQRFDRQVSRAMSDVALPQGLAERLLATVASSSIGPGALDSSGDQLKSVLSSPVRHRSPGRRVGWSVIAALVPLVVIGGLLLGSRAPVLNENSVLELGQLNPNSFLVEAPQTPFAPPAGWGSLRSIQLGETSHSATINGVKVPVRSMLVRMDRRSPNVTGLLVRLPRSQWSSTPDAISFSSATIQYAPFGTWVVWREGDVVFVCIVRENAHIMQRLQDAVAGSREFT